MSNDGKAMSVGVLARHAGCNVETVRYYENAGLMPEPPRSPGGHRQYAHAHLQRLCFIRRSRELGFPVEQVRALLRLVDEPEHTCGEVKDMAIWQVNEVQRRIDDLRRLQRALNDMARQCGGGRSSVDDCPIIEALFADAPQVTAERTGGGPCDRGRGSATDR
jgi:MerR family mercuric resistance operon transcriptional regulator